MKFAFRAVLAVYAITAAGCWKRDQQPLEPTVLEQVCSAAFAPFYDEKKHTRYHHVSFTGYLATPKSAMISTTMFVEVYSKPNRMGEKVLASFSVGSRKNFVERLKNGYKETDLKIESNSGVALSHGSKVKIEGDVSPGGIPGKVDNSCYVRVDSVESAP